VDLLRAGGARVTRRFFFSLFAGLAALPIFGARSRPKKIKLTCVADPRVGEHTEWFLRYDDQYTKPIGEWSDVGYFGSNPDITVGKMTEVINSSSGIVRLY
jgi:hypothetical protein